MASHAAASAQPPLGEFEIMVLLAVLHLSSGDAAGTDAAYGSTIVREIATRTGRDVSRGAVYVTLDRLEAKRLLTSRAGAAPPERGGRPRRIYRVTPPGLRATRHSLSAFARMHTGLEPVIGRL
jgi:DNA-binding PadR family transcriptional regulator